MCRRAVVLGLIAAAGLASCGTNEEQAIRHLLTAELIEKEQMPDSHIEIQSVRFLSNQEAVAHATVLGQGRAEATRAFQCKLKRESGRWIVEKIEPE